MTRPPVHGARGGFTLRRLALRQLRTDPLSALLLVGLTALVAALAAIAPVQLTRIADREIAHSVGQQSSLSRDLSATVSGQQPNFQPPPTGVTVDLPEQSHAVWGTFAADLETVRQGLPPLVRETTAPARFFSTYPKMSVSTPNPALGSTAIEIVTDPFFAEHLTLVAGRLPRYSTDPETGVMRWEILLGRQAAAEQQWQVGETRELSSDYGEGMPITLAGLVELNGEQPDYLAHNPFAVTANVFDDGDRPRSVTLTAYPPTEGNEGIALNSALTLWYPTRLGQLSIGQAEQLAAELRRVTVSEYPMAHPAAAQDWIPAFETVRLTSELPGTLEQAVGRVRATNAVLLIAVLGPAGTALAVLVLSVQSFLRRRRPALATLRVRGAAGGQLRRIVGLQGLLVGIPGALIGLGVSRWVLGQWSWLAAAAAGLCALVPAIGAAAGLGQASVLAARTDLGRGRWRIGRLLFDLAVLGAAVWAVRTWLTGTATGFDPLVLLAPLLCIAAVCVLVLRLYPVPVYALHRLFARSRGLVGTVGSARTVRDPVVGLPFILAGTTGIAVTVFSIITLHTVNRGIAVAAQQQVGADLVVSGPWMNPELVAQVEAVAGVERVATVGYAGSVTLRGPQVPAGPGQPPAKAVSVNLYVADTAALADVQRDIADAPEIPARMTVPDRKAPLPAVVSAQALEALGIPGTTTARVDRTTIAVVGTGRSPAGLSANDSWMLIDAAAQKVNPLNSSSTSPTAIYLRMTPNADRAAVGEKIRQLMVKTGGQATFQKPTEQAAALAASPTIGGMRQLLIGCIAISLVLLGIAVGVTAAAGGRIRLQLMAVLRLLGTTRGQIARLVAWELWPPALAALLAGGALGWALSHLTIRAVDLRPFTGGRVPPALAVPAGPVLAALALFAALTTVAIAAAAIRARRIDAAHWLKTSE